jgi:hypothetical protein
VVLSAIPCGNAAEACCLDGGEFFRKRCLNCFIAVFFGVRAETMRREFESEDRTKTSAPHLRINSGGAQFAPRLIREWIRTKLELH